MADFPFDAVLFDCDGVLVDSEPITNRVLTEMLGELGWQLSVEETMRIFVGKAVRDQPGAALQGRTDHLVQMIGAGGIHHQKLADRRPARGVTAHQEVTQGFSARRSAGLTRLHHFEAERAQFRHQGLDLGGLAGALTAFKSDEAPAVMGGMFG